MPGPHARCAPQPSRGERSGMRLEQLTMDLVGKAVAIFLQHAYGGSGRPGRMPDLSLPAESSPEQVLGLFQREAYEDAHGHKAVRYTLRLGNRNYPFMKLLLQEHLVAGEWCFAVDTHDEMNIKPDYPDYEAWMSVRRFNSNLKREIECSLAAAGIPTSAALREVCAQRDQTAPAGTGTSILIVDDEEDLAESVAALLRARGYRTYRASDGRTALRLAAELHPDLVLLDYELPEMDGLEVIAALRARPVTAHIPILFATASRVSLEEVRRADGFLAKPFQEDLLYEVVHRTMTARRGVS